MLRHQKNIKTFPTHVARSLGCQSWVLTSGASAPYMHETRHSLGQTAVNVAHIVGDVAGHLTRGKSLFHQYSTGFILNTWDFPSDKLLLI